MCIRDRMEEGKLRLTDPVSRFVPEFKELKVAVIKPGYVAPQVPAGQQPPIPDYYTVPANREITIRDLLTHTSGLESGNLGNLSLIHISEPTRLLSISYAVFC